MEINEFREREYFINEYGRIFDNSLNENLEDNVLEVCDKEIKEIFNNQKEDIKEFFKTELKGGLNK